MVSMRCFYLKIGKGNSLAKSWLAGENPLNRPAAVIFFRHCTIEDIRDGKTDPQARSFYETSLPQARHQTLIVVVAHGMAWFLKPAGGMIEHKSPTDTENLWKIMPVDIISSCKLTKVPPVLAGINANAYLSRGTYREITNWGNIKAIYSFLKWPLPEEHLLTEEHTPQRLLECLSSIELETLTAKVFEAAGCFVSAYRGGYVQDIDLFVHNDHMTAIVLDGLSIAPKSSISVQVKGYTALKKCPETVDYLIGFGVPKSPKSFDENWLLNQVQTFPSVANWLRRSLDWLPNDFVSRCGL